MKVWNTPRNLPFNGNICRSPLQQNEPFTIAIGHFW